MKGALHEDVRTRYAGAAVRVLGLLLLLAVVLFEAYYIIVLRERTDSQSDELKHISVQLQSMKTENTTLREELSSARKSAGEVDHGNAPDR